jgi:hypothetical protein
MAPKKDAIGDGKIDWLAPYQTYMEYIREQEAC